jgi:erythronate-4-phosphate dehydrogenase
MKIVVDENIIFAEEAFAEFGTVKLINGRSINNKVLTDADVLIVRSITKVDKYLLQNTPVKFVGTATIGREHIDIDYLLKNEIAFADAKGCNADSVSEYVFTALLKVAVDEKIRVSEKSIGIVGVGNIGSRIEKHAKTLGMKVLKNDPPKEREGIGSGYVTLDEILKADIISLHVPLNIKGKDKTVHLLNEQNLKKLKPGAIIINTSRGQVSDNNALLDETKRKCFSLILDVWENEPDLNIELLKKTKIGTAHIAGYSLEGKANGTKIIYNSLCKYLNKKNEWEPLLMNLEDATHSLQQGKTFEEKLHGLFSSIYNIEEDDKKLKDIYSMRDDKIKGHFDNLRKEYPVRREFSNHTITLQQQDLIFNPILEAFRFKVKC